MTRNSNYYLNNLSVNSQTGLSDSQVEKRLLEYGENRLVQVKSKPIFVVFIRGFLNPLSLLLLFMSIGMYALGDMIEGSLILAMVTISVILDFYQERKADQAVKKLQTRVAQYAEVIRNGVQQDVLLETIVPGDILLLNTGDIVAADGIVIEGRNFYTNQSSLTGESAPVEKKPLPDNISLDNLEDLNSPYLVFNGTNISSGSAKVLVMKTANLTQFSKIAASLSQVEEVSQFNIGIVSFSKFVLKIVTVVVFIIFLTYGLTGHTWMSALTFSVATAIGITPDFLMVIMSLCMSYGSQRMAKKGVIIKKMSAMASFGSIEILCTDKTGTLTEDRISLIKHTGVFGKNDERVLFFAQLNSFLQGGLSSQMDAAVLSNYIDDLNQYKKIDEIPFDFDRRSLSVIADNDLLHERYLITKGAPEDIFQRCNFYHDNGKTLEINQKIKNELELQYRLLSEDGFRVLAVAIKKERYGENKDYGISDEKDLEILGFISFMDPVKKDVKTTIAELAQINIKTKVITGDSEVIARKICEQAGIFSERILIGNEIDEMSDKQLISIIENINIFARFSPSQKERVIHCFQKSGKCVGYMGDGINDAPSLKAADVGISVENAVDVASEAADIILTHKSLRELEFGVIEGRKTFVNTMKYVKIGMASSVGNVISLLIAAFALPFLPMLPIQVLLNDLLYDISQLGLASDNVDSEETLTPQKWNLKEIWKFILIFGPLSSVFDLILFFILFVFVKVDPAEFQTSWFIYSLITQLLALFIMRTSKSLLKSRPSRKLVLISFAMAITGITIVFSQLGILFEFARGLNLFIIGICVADICLYIIAMEIAKYFYFKKNILRKNK